MIFICQFEMSKKKKFKYVKIVSAREVRTNIRPLRTKFIEIVIFSTRTLSNIFPLHMENYILWPKDHRTDHQRTGSNEQCIHWSSGWRFHEHLVASINALNLILKLVYCLWFVCVHFWFHKCSRKKPQDLFAGFDVASVDVVSFTQNYEKPESVADFRYTTFCSFGCLRTHWGGNGGSLRWKLLFLWSSWSQQVKHP